MNWDSTKGGETPWDVDYYQDRGKTSAGFDKEYIKGDYPDSANTASNLYGGIKAYNGAISVDIGEHGFESILMEAQVLGKSMVLLHRCQSTMKLPQQLPLMSIPAINTRNHPTPASLV